MNFKKPLLELNCNPRRKRQGKLVTINQKRELVIMLGMILLEVGGLALILFLPTSRLGKLLLVMYMVAIFIGTIVLVAIIENRGEN